MSATPPVIILVRPQMAENIGATARAMVNFGATDLRLVNPREYDAVRAERMACDGRDVLSQVKIFPDLKSALVDCNYSIATSRRLRRVKIPPLEPRSAIALLRTLSNPSRPALVFGAEQSGLSNEELFLCDSASSIPTTELGSLNLAQSVVVFLYEWFTAQPVVVPVESGDWNRLATHAEKQRNYDLIEKLLRAADYKPIGRLPEFIRRVKLLFENRPLSFREQKIMLKVLRYFEKVVSPTND